MDKEESEAKNRQLLLKDLREPIVLKNQLENWPCRNWDISEWGKKFNSKKIKFRVGPIDNNTGDPLWEHECEYVEATLEQFLCRSAHEEDLPGPFERFPTNSHWVYADYKYMAHLFSPQDEINKSVDWGNFGFTGRQGADSTFWLGSVHSHTPCHYDTYGCNLVAQLIGSKRWVLFPPQSTSCLYPTRIPYEESSVFSAVNVCHPNLKAHSRFKMTRPIVVTLNAGDALFVPSRWWHFVQSITEHTLSINSWIEMDCDEDRRLEEAVSRELITNFNLVHQMDNWINPTEDLVSPETNLAYIENCLKTISSKAAVNKSCSTSKRKRESSGDIFHLLEICFGKNNIQQLHPISFEEFLEHTNSSLSDLSDPEEKNNLKLEFLNAVLHPEVVALICQKLKSK